VAFRPFSDLRELPAEPEWLWQGYLAAGLVTLLAGHAFVGKSTLVSGLLKALEEGESFIGRPVERSSAVLLAEEHASALRARAELFGSLEIGSDFVSRDRGVFSLPWPTLIAAATEHALEDGHSLLIVDTFTGLAGLSREDENDAGAIAERLRPLQEAAGQGLAVLVLHHMNAQGGPRGSTAFRGIADIELRLNRNRNSQAIRLESFSRYSTAPTLHASLIEASGRYLYQAREPAEAATAARSRSTSMDERLWNALLQAGPAGLSYSQIGDLDGLSVDIAKRRLPRWHEDGRVTRTGEGTKGSPYRWVAAEP
jgi:hypothetical protein